MTHILILNHDLDDTRDIREALGRTVSSVEFLLTETLEQLRSKLSHTTIQLLVIATRTAAVLELPMQALVLAQQISRDTPIIIFAEDHCCENAMNFVRAGAADFIHAGDCEQLFLSTLHILGERETRRRDSSISEVLIRAGRQWRATFDAMQDAVCVTDEHGIILRANKAFQQFLQLSWTEIINREFDDLTGIVSDFGAMKAGQHQEQYFARDGHWFRLSVVQSNFDEKQDEREHIRIISDISYARQLEKSLLESESRHLKFFNKLPLGVLYQDQSGKIIACNPASETILGIPARELVGQDLPDLDYGTTEEIRSSFLLNGSEFFQLLKDGRAVKDKILDFTHRVSREHRWIKINAIPLKSDDSQSTDLAAYVIEDITEEKTAVEKVRNTAAQLNTIFRSVPITMMIIDSSHVIREINLPTDNTESRQAEGLVGRGKGAAIGCMYAHKDHQACGKHPHCAGCGLRKTVSDTIHAQQEFSNIEVDLVLDRAHADRTQSFLVHSSPILYQNEAMCLLVMNDITEIKQTQHALEKSVAQLKTAKKKLQQTSRWVRTLNNFAQQAARQQSMQTLIDLMFIYLDKNFDHSFGILSFQKDLSGQLEVQSLSSHGADLRKIFTPGMHVNAEDFPTILTDKKKSQIIPVSDLMDGPDTSIWQGVLSLLQSKLVQSILKIPFSLSHNTTAFLYLAFSDRTRLNSDEWRFLNNLTEFLSLAISNWKLYSELEQSYAQLSQALEHMSQQRRMEAMGQLASGITHDINNALVPILLYTESLLSSPDVNTEKQHRYLQAIQNAAQDIEHVATRMRAFYRKSDAGELNEIMVCKLFDEVIDLTYPLWESAANKKGKKIRITRNVSGEPVIRANTSELRESLTNMIINSCDAIDEDGTISLIASQNTEGTLIAIQDTGHGMNEETVQRCVEPFFSTKGVDGTGLGLPAVFGMMQRYNGTMQIESRIGEGTSIQLYFPHNPEEQDASQGIENEPYPEGLKILLTEDDTRVLPVLKEMLQIDNHEVFTASTGTEAMNLLVNEYEKGLPFQVLITDYGMAHINGIQLAAQAREFQPEIPVILLTGWGVLMQEDEQPDNVDIVLSKPPKIKVFRKCLRSLTASKDQHTNGGNRHG